MNNENLDKHSIDIPGAGIIKEVDMSKEEPHILESGPNPMKEGLETEEHNKEEVIEKINILINAFEAVRSKYNLENRPGTTDEDRKKIIADREQDNHSVKTLQDQLLSLQSACSTLSLTREEQRITHYLEEIKTFLQNNI